MGATILFRINEPYIFLTAKPRVVMIVLLGKLSDSDQREGFVLLFCLPLALTHIIHMQISFFLRGQIDEQTVDPSRRIFFENINLVCFGIQSMMPKQIERSIPYAP
jgi:hypothetical protein